MHEPLSRTAIAAINAADHLVSEPQRSTAPETSTDHLDQGWFVELAESLTPKDSGFALHLTTGFEQRTCYRYASGERKTPGYFIRALLRSDQGKQWLSGLMQGSDVDWWREHQRAERIAAQIDRLNLE